MRARHPDHDGYVERNGVKLFYEVSGDGEPTRWRPRVRKRPARGRLKGALFR